MNDFSKFDEEKFINDFSHFYTGLTSQVIIWMPTLNLLFSMMRFLNLQIDNPYAIANIFNNFFVNVGINTNKDIPNGNCCRTFLLKGNFPDSVEVDSYISQMDDN